MKKSIALKTIASSVGVLCHSTIFAHDGHGLSGAHWHATDTWGLVLALAVAVCIIAAWPGGRK
ncbi:MAG: hypothetical protein EAZ34_10135 [Polaromonas sp.]|nr:MAG: hypothetical protein EAZ34_10135 [Polaromonas sp.]